MIARAQHAERAAWRAWQESLEAEPYDSAAEELRRRAYDRACEQARKVLKDREIGLAGDRDWCRWDDVEERVQAGLGVLGQSLRSAPVRVATKLALPPEQFRRLNDLWQSELDSIFSSLAAVDFRRPVVDAEDELTLAAE